MHVEWKTVMLMAKVVVENLAEHVESYECHAGKHYPDGISHHLGVAGMAANMLHYVLNIQNTVQYSFDKHQSQSRIYHMLLAP